MTPQELKNSILQLAIQGKLVEQRPEEQPVHLDGLKIKKTDEYEFDLPEQWITGHIETITSPVPTKQYQILESQVCKEGKYPVISQSKDYSIGFTDDTEKLYTHINPVIIFGDHTTVVKLVDFDFVVGADGVKIFYPVENVISAEFLYYVMQYFTFGLEKIGGYSRHYKYIKDRTFPLPPLAEQKRIVAKIEELLPLIDRYEAAWSRLEEFNKRFPGDMQKSLLQMAIQGKLVEQRPEEGTGEELYTQIQAEKQALIKSGKTKKDKPLPEITDDEKPFDIPDSWKWVHINEVIDVRDGTHDTPKYVSNGVPLVTSKNLIDGSIDFDTAKLISIDDSNAINLRSKVDDGDILFAMIGTIGNPVLVKKDREFSIKNMALFKQYNEDLFEMKYLLYFLRLAQSEMKKVASASVQSFVSLSVLRNYLMPLPPFAEQKRIVAKLEELLPLCESLI